jgi:hypothetical protein
MVKPITIRIVLTIAMSSGWSIKQIDVSNAFFHGFFIEKVYIFQSMGFVHPQQPNFVWFLKKMLCMASNKPHALGSHI